jgi:glucose-6-phosphate isomerase
MRRSKLENGMQNMEIRPSALGCGVRGRRPFFRIPKNYNFQDNKNAGTSTDVSAGSGAGTRTPIAWARTKCPTVRRPPNNFAKRILYQNRPFVKHLCYTLCMAKALLTYDDANMKSERAGAFGMSGSECNEILPRLRSAKKALRKISKKKEQGFLDLPLDRRLHEDALNAAQKASKAFTDLLVLGIGGSDLGARAIERAVIQNRPKKKGSMRLHFAGSSTDPDELSAVFSGLNLKKTCVCVVSKSGGTLETMSAFLVLRDRLIARAGKRRFARHIVAVTDPESGALRDLARKERYTALSIPANVGGRFSVLSPAGLFPAAAAGADTDLLLAGARAQVNRFHEADAGECEALRYAGYHAAGMEKRKQNVHVLMPYGAGLSEFARWVRQLTAESIGKKHDRNGNEVHIGATPVAAMGPEDQHSQLQLYAEGPCDKIITFIRVKRFKNDLETPPSRIHPKLEAFGGKKFSRIINTEQAATAESLARVMRPNGTLEITRVNEHCLGELFMFFEIATAAMGELLNVNAFDQPGVELSKKLMRDALKRQKTGY